MEKQCYRCGGELPENAVFCPACNAPQIRVPVPSEEAEETGPASAQPQAPLSQRPQAITVPALAERIQWKVFLSTGWPLALIAGLLAGFVPLLGILLLLPLTVVIAVRMYRKRHFVALRGGQGARLGFVLGLISFCGFAPVFAAVITLNQTFHQQLLEGMSQAAARNPDPQVRQIMESMLTTREGFAILVGFSLVFFLAIILAITTAVGAIAARSASRQRA
jgi:hypothetical protein